ncbi:hypothetical protein L3Z60_004716, partial [Escherichia coli]|nr:hypothetical protein [Escherichia coli]
VTGSSLQFLYQQSQELFADIAIEAERPVPERYLTADTEGSGVRFPARLHRLNQIQQG